MKIETITLREIQMPLVHFFETSFGRLYSRRILLLTVQCDGVVGWGECVAAEDPFYSSEWIEPAWSTIKHYLAPAVLGHTLTAATRARDSWPGCEGTAWPRLPSRMRCGTRSRYRSTSPYGSCWGVRRARFSAASPSAYRTPLSNCWTKLNSNSLQVTAGSR